MDTVPPGDGARTHFAALTDLADRHALAFSTRAVLADLVGRVNAEGVLNHVTITDWAQTVGIHRRALAAAVGQLVDLGLATTYFPRGHVGHVALVGEAALLVCAPVRVRPGTTPTSSTVRERPGTTPTSRLGRERPGHAPDGHTRGMRLVTVGTDPQVPGTPSARTPMRERPGTTPTSPPGRERPGTSAAPKERKEELLSFQPHTDLFDQLCGSLPADAAGALRHRSNTGCRREITALLDTLAAGADPAAVVAATTRDLPGAVHNWPGFILARVRDIAADPTALDDVSALDPTAREHEAARAYGRHQARQVAAAVWDLDTAHSDIRYRYREHPDSAELVAIAAAALAAALPPPLAVAQAT